MKKLIFILSILFYSITSFSQNRVIRGTLTVSESLNVTNDLNVGGNSITQGNVVGNNIPIVPDTIITPVGLNIENIYLNQFTGSDITGNGSDTLPYKTLSHAVNQHNYYWEGRTFINLGPGEYKYSEIEPYLKKLPSPNITLVGSRDSIGSITGLSLVPNHHFRYTYNESLPDSTLLNGRLSTLTPPVNPIPWTTLPILNNLNDTLITPLTTLSGDYMIVDLTTTMDIDVAPDLDKSLGFTNLEIVPNRIIIAGGLYVSFTACDLVANSDTANVWLTLRSVNGNMLNLCNIGGSSSSSAGQVVWSGGSSLNYFYNSIIQAMNGSSQGIDAGYGSYAYVVNTVFKNTAGSLITQNSTVNLNGHIYIVSNPGRGIFNFDEETGVFLSNAFADVFIYVDQTNSIFYGTNPERSNQYFADLRAVTFVPKAGFTLPVESWSNIHDLDEMIYTPIGSTTTLTKIDSVEIGDLQVTGSIKQTQLTGSLTDGTPTALEINTVTGLTPSTAGAGWSVTIKDSDGSGLLYRVESDGTSWQYITMTITL